ncbi:MAG: D-glycero-beta-D-manno-heptose-7-phosphate kinase [Candidatus Aminicenantes bacterium]|nr:D-glycero-beta-D-manno-heptose-7-phosphate kinase [Candidatus Aminicenantes bacterium]
MTTIDTKNMKKIVHNFKNKRVLVLGDIMLDKYIWGHVARISPEAPVPVVEVEKDTSCLGGAGNSCHNLESLGAFPLLTGVVGNDQEGKWIIKNVPDSRGIFVDKSRPTSVKTRIVAHHQQVVRVDLEKKSTISSQIEEKLFNFIKQEEYDGILMSDYNKGVITKSLMNKLLALAQKRKIPVFVDPKVENFSLFSPVTLLTPNHFEAEKIVHHECLTDSDVEKAGQKILSHISTPYLIIKRGEQGMTVFEKGKKPLHIPTVAKEVYDVTGAGDTVIVTAALALLSGGTIQEAAVLANTAAGIVAGKIGTAAVTAEELLSFLPG